MKNLLKVIVISSAVAGTVSCATAVIGGSAAGAGVATGLDARGSKMVMKDQHIEHKVNNVLSAQIPKGSFTVASYDRHVLLAGQVPSAADKAKAETAASNTYGVTGVWNYLTVGPNESVGDITKDAYLTSAAKTRLIAQKDVNTNNIKVVTSNGVVYLLGMKAGNSREIRGAITGIKGIDGVKNVVNLIK